MADTDPGEKNNLLPAKQAELLSSSHKSIPFWGGKTPRFICQAFLFGRLRAQFSDDETVELTALIGFQNLSSKFNSALGVPAQGFCLPPGSSKKE